MMYIYFHTFFFSNRLAQCDINTTRKRTVIFLMFKTTLFAAGMAQPYHLKRINCSCPSLKVLVMVVTLSQNIFMMKTMTLSVIIG